MIFDAFTFFNETQILKIRLHELNDVVDRFVIVEADKCFTGAPKPFNFLANREMFKPFLDKIIYVQVSDMPTVDNPWLREIHQRNAIMRGLDGLRDGDVVIFSDVDEIPRRGIVPSFSGDQFSEIWAIDMSMYYFYLNWAVLPDKLCAMICTGKKLKTLPSIHDARIKGVPPEHHIRNGGWHFSYMGGLDKVVYKIKSFSHGLDEGPKRSAMLLETGVVNFNDFSWFLRKVHIDATFPKYVQDHQAELIEKGFILV